MCIELMKNQGTTSSRSPLSYLVLSYRQYMAGEGQIQKTWRHSLRLTSRDVKPSFSTAIIGRWGGYPNRHSSLFYMLNCVGSYLSPPPIMCPSCQIRPHHPECSGGRLVGGRTAQTAPTPRCHKRQGRKCGTCKFFHPGSSFNSLECKNSLLGSHDLPLLLTHWTGAVTPEP